MTPNIAVFNTLKKKKKKTFVIKSVLNQNAIEQK